MTYTKENIVEGIYSKLDEMYGENKTYRGLLKFLKQELVNYPIEVEQNVLEWVNGEPISDVDCCGISIKSVMEACHRSIGAFPHILLNFINFKNNGFRNQATCFAGFVEYD